MHGERRMWKTEILINIGGKKKRNKSGCRDKTPVVAMALGWTQQAGVHDQEVEQG